MNRKQGAPQDIHSLVMSADFKPPVKIPGCRRRAKDFKQKFVMRLCVGIATIYTTDMHFIVTFLEGAVTKGVNANITMLAALLHWSVWNPATMSAWKLFLEWDGGGENTAWPMLGFGSMCVDKGLIGWWESHRNLPGHGHDGDDQDFRVMDMGWKSSFLTTNLAQALVKLLLAFKTKRARYMILLLTCSYDWKQYFAPCMNKYIKYYNQPLAWRIRKLTPDALPTAEQKRNVLSISQYLLLSLDVHD